MSAKETLIPTGRYRIVSPTIALFEQGGKYVAAAVAEGTTVGGCDEEDTSRVPFSFFQANVDLQILECR